MTYGGYEGFENEAIRQDTLRGAPLHKGGHGFTYQAQREHQRAAGVARWGGAPRAARDPPA
eukprot:CAMPEP_0182853810 /NCGR_PEP_ID=MMETSP0034_2-20130328/902_1 /TAXON_ID=156128 /ORGANISM="Nephroselmis pyriformis, Strain CCMP717" /LENGTH=60 /DNA_ID=CAMNT_0024984591 /DNA_START=159 /DNA_END=336 /DNA_ORIENTATION=-